MPWGTEEMAQQLVTFIANAKDQTQNPRAQVGWLTSRSLLYLFLNASNYFL